MSELLEFVEKSGDFISVRVKSDGFEIAEINMNFLFVHFFAVAFKTELREIADYIENNLRG